MLKKQALPVCQTVAPEEAFDPLHRRRGDLDRLTENSMTVRVTYNHCFTTCS